MNGTGGFGVCPPDVHAAADTILRLSEQVGDIGLLAPLADLAAALPGGHAATAAAHCELARAIPEWATRAHDHALAMTGAVTGYRQSDQWPPLGYPRLPSVLPADPPGSR